MLFHRMVCIYEGFWQKYEVQFGVSWTRSQEGDQGSRRAELPEGQRKGVSCVELLPKDQTAGGSVWPTVDQATLSPPEAPC